jgi:hypothetical protein
LEGSNAAERTRIAYLAARAVMNFSTGTMKNTGSGKRSPVRFLGVEACRKGYRETPTAEYKNFPYSGGDGVNIYRFAIVSLRQQFSDNAVTIRTM